MFVNRQLFDKHIKSLFNEKHDPNSFHFIKNFLHYQQLIQKFTWFQCYLKSYERCYQTINTIKLLKYSQKKYFIIT